MPPLSRTLPILLAGVLSVLIPSPGGAVRGNRPPQSGIHPYLKRLVEGRSPSALIKHGRIVLDESGKMVRVFISGEPAEEVEKKVRDLGGRVLGRYTGFISAFVPMAGLKSLGGKPVLSVDPVERLAPLLDKSVPAIHGDLAHFGIGLPRGYTGKDVILGIVDTGIDLRHPAFLYSDGSTRVISLWDQTASYGAPPAAYSYGQECTGEDINRRQCPENDCGATVGGTYISGGHGTHVAGIAGGGGIPYTGAAPDAIMIFVKTDFYEDHVIDAIRYILEKGKSVGKPVVVNLSAGANDGPHDGTTLLETNLTALVSTGAPIVAASGNDGGVNIHAGYALSPGAEMRTGIIPWTNGDIQIETWFSGPSSLRVGIGLEGPDGGNFVTQTGLVVPYEPSRSFTLNDGATQVGQVTIDASQGADYHPNHDNQVIITISPQATGFAYPWEIVFFSPTTGTPTSVDSWITSYNAEFDTYTGNKFTGQALSADNFTFFTFQGGDERMTVNRPSTAPGVIAVGSFATRLSWNDSAGQTVSLCAVFPATCGDQISSISYFSSRGPSRDPAFTGLKPTISAPGEAVVSTLPSCIDPGTSWISGGGGYYANLGTSMAGPHVAGVAALLLDRDPGLTSQAVSSLIAGSALTDSFTGQPPADDIWGAGKLDAFTALIQAPEAGVDTTPPVLSGIKVKTSLNSVVISWNTDELASGRVDYWRSASLSSDSAGTLTPSLDHHVTLEGLSVNQTYDCVVSSADLRGNLSKSPVLSFRVAFTGRGCGCRTSPDDPVSWGIEVVLALFLLKAIRRRLQSA